MAKKKLDLYKQNEIYTEVEYRIERFTEGLASWCEKRAAVFGISAQEVYNLAIKYARKML